MPRHAPKRTQKAFRELAVRAGMCSAATLLDPPETAPVNTQPKKLQFKQTESAPDQIVSGGGAWSLPTRQLWECVCTGPSAGGQSLLQCYLRASWQTGAYHAFIDATHSFDPQSLSEDLAERLLWVPVQGPQQTTRALDLLLRDDNFALVAADLRALSQSEFQQIQPSAWYRLQRLAHHRTGGALILSSSPQVRCADRRVFLQNPRTLEDLDIPRQTLLDQLQATTRSYPRGRLPSEGDHPIALAI